MPSTFTLRMDNQALAWLKTYSTDQAIIGRWIEALEKYPFAIQHRPRTSIEMQMDLASEGTTMKNMTNS